MVRFDFRLTINTCYVIGIVPGNISGNVTENAATFYNKRKVLSNGTLRDGFVDITDRVIRGSRGKEPGIQNSSVARFVIKWGGPNHAGAYEMS
jgi:hypothetical protein